MSSIFVLVYTQIHIIIHLTIQKKKKKKKKKKKIIIHKKINYNDHFTVPELTETEGSAVLPTITTTTQ